MITVYAGRPPFKALKGHVRDIRVTWLLEELGVPYTTKLLDMGEHQHKTPEYKAINPFGKIPAITDGDLKLFESSAINIYLADKYGKGRMIPAHGTLDRARHDQWMFYAVSTLEPIAIRLVGARAFSEHPEKAVSATVAELKGAGIGPNHLEVLEARFANQEFILGKEMTVADISLSCTLSFCNHPELIGEYAYLAQYLERLQARPAYEKAYEINAGF